MRRNVHAETRLGRHKNLRTLEDLRAARLEADVDMRSISAGGDDDMVCGLDVCGELVEYPSDVHVNDCEGENNDANDRSHFLAR